MNPPFRYPLYRSLLVIPALILSSGTIAQSIYRQPHEVGINVNLIESAEKEIASGSPACTSLLPALAAEIGKFTTQFVDDKRILDERRAGPLRPENLDKNTIRLIERLREREYGKINFLSNSPYMVRLHRAMGRCYEIQDKKYRALAEYTMAFRYSGFEQPWRDLPAIDYDNPPAAALREREIVFLQMNRGFADPDRLPEESNAEYRSAATEFRDALRQYLKGKIEMTIAERKIDAFIARNARGDNSVSVSAARDEYNRLRQNQSRLLRGLDEIRQGAYRRYQAQKRKDDCRSAIAMARLTRDLEAKNKRLLRILNRSSYYRGRGESLSEERTRLVRFVGYAIFLELAHKIDPDNAEVPTLLAEEYRKSRQYRRAVEFENRAIQIKSKITPPPAAELAGHYRRLGGLYTDLKDFQPAVVAYRDYLRWTQDNEEAPRVRLHMADIQFRHTGDFAEAEKLYEQYVMETAALDENSLGYRARTELLTTRYRVNMNLAAIKRRKYRTAAEIERLSAARNEFDKLEMMLKTVSAEETEMRRKILDLKKILVAREDDELQLQYYTLLRRDLPDVRERKNHIAVQLRSLNLPLLLERMALIDIRRRNFEGALDRYREIIRRGNGGQVSRARGNITLIRRSLEDGRLRKPILPAGFER